MDFSNIFVVFDPTREEQPALDRAIAVTKGQDVALHIFACIFSDTSKAKNSEDDIAGQIAQQKRVLNAIAEPLISKGATVTTEVEWGKDWYSAVIHSSVNNNASVVFKSTYKHAAHQRLFNRTSDWTLIRECLCPVLLVREGCKLLNDRRVLAAIDVRSEKDSYIQLNQNIIDFSKKVLESENTEMHFINAYQDSINFPDRGELIKSCGVDSDRIHIKKGSTDKVIVDYARKLDANLVVIGNSVRSGLSALIHGNTAEKILDDLDCDVLTLP